MFDVRTLFLVGDTLNIKHVEMPFCYSYSLVNI